MLPSAKCGLVIGKGGENIKRVSVRKTIKIVGIYKIRFCCFL
jgi:hypothetical protein